MNQRRSPPVHVPGIAPDPSPTEYPSGCYVEYIGGVSAPPLLTFNPFAGNAAYGDSAAPDAVVRQSLCGCHTAASVCSLDCAACPGGIPQGCCSPDGNGASCIAAASLSSCPDAYCPAKAVAEPVLSSTGVGNFPDALPLLSVARIDVSAAVLPFAPLSAMRVR